MAKHEIKLMGDPVLRVPAEELTIEEIRTQETQDLIDDMLDTMEHYGGIGIAAPQIGISKQIALIDAAPLGSESEDEDDDEEEEREIIAIINPKFKVLDETKQGFWEGCLSVPGLRGFVERPRKLEIEYLDQNGDEQSIVVEDFLATVFQHELDHLFATLYVDKVKDKSLLVFEETFELQTQEEG